MMITTSRAKNTPREIVPLCVSIIALLVTSVVVALFTTVVAIAEPMHFEVVRNGGNCASCSYTQATGEITSETPKQFESFAASQKFGTGIVRLDSPGGNLVGGITLGELFRAHGISTEVGSSAPIPQAIEAGVADRSPGICASACAYAYLGGVERALDRDAKLGFHRFYQEDALAQPSAKLFTGQDLGNAQMTTAALTLYTLKMGVDASLVALAASAGPSEMHWMSREDAQKLRVTYDPRAYKPWRVETYRGGAIAVAESSDSSKNVVVSCSRQLGPNVALIDLKPLSEAASWYEQCSRLNLPDGQPVLGTKVGIDRIRVIRRKDGSLVMRFQLPTVNPSLTSSNLLSFDDGYPRACSSGDFLTTRENFVPAVRVALRNCFQD
jgi:hypothetical protein